MRPIPILMVILAIAGCRDNVAVVPDAVTMNEDALGHYCQMKLIEHEGPKGQVHMDGMPAPMFFAQVRDAIAYLHEPEKVAPVSAVYVSNMSRAVSWAEPGTDNWIDASKAFFVVGSDAIGGMGVPELVPFETNADALKFASDHGGRVLGLEDIPTDAVLGAVDNSEPMTEMEHNK